MGSRRSSLVPYRYNREIMEDVDGVNLLMDILITSNLSYKDNETDRLLEEEDGKTSISNYS